MPRYPAYTPGGPGYYPNSDLPILGPRIWPNGNGPDPGVPLTSSSKFGFGQAQATIRGNAYGQAQGDIKQTYQQYGQCQADIKHTYQQYAQAQATILGWAFGQAQGDIKAVGYGWGQCQAYINGAVTQYGQAQAFISKGALYGQAQADILATNQQYGQAQGDILATNQQYGQANAYVFGATSQFGQAQAFIQKSAGYGQARALIAQVRILDLFDRTTDINTPGTPTIGPPYNTESPYVFNAISDINGTNLTVSYPEGNAVGSLDGEITTGALGEVQEHYIEFTAASYFTDPLWNGTYCEIVTYEPTFSNYAGAFFSQFDSDNLILNVEISIDDDYEEDLSGAIIPFEGGATYGLKFRLAGNRIRAKLWRLLDPEPDWQVDHTHSSPTLFHGTYISYYFFDPFDVGPTSTTFDNYMVLSPEPVYPTGQAQASILRTVNKHAQAQATIIRRLASGQAQARILAVVNKFAQAQAKISKSALYGQAQADIKKTTNKFAQARAQINQSKQTGQAQADIKKINNNKFAQARAKITHTLFQFAQAQADIKARGRGFGQAQASIDYPIWAFGQAQAEIHRFEGYGQSNALIDSPIKNQYGQANADITRPIRYAQAQALIFHPMSGQAQALIRKYPFQFAQSKADIKATINQVGQAQAAIVNSMVYAQAQAYIIGGTSYGQAQGLIVVRGKVFAQAQAYIGRNQGYGQAQAVIKHGFSGQAQAYIRLAVFKWGLAQGLIVNSNVSIERYKTGHAQAFIRKTVKCGQAQAMIKSKTMGFGQAQAQIARSIGFGQAQAYISGGRYIVQFNGQQLPGFAQMEQFESPEDISDNYATYQDATFSEYMGLQNKILSLQMRVMGSDLADVKSQISQGATILRSKRQGFTKTYIQRADRYYLTIVKNVTTSHDVRTNKTADYVVSFEAKPWVISTTTYSASGTGLISTDARTLYDGGWTPTRVRVTGTDITISGYTDGEFTGFISVSGAVTDLNINSESLTATIGGVNKNNLMNNIDYSLYVGPGNTYFQIDGATECVIEWEDRWYL